MYLIHIKQLVQISYDVDKKIAANYSILSSLQRKILRKTNILSYQFSLPSYLSTFPSHPHPQL
jgi:hypothetical protein